jgi:hypothetical protein
MKFLSREQVFELMRKNNYAVFENDSKEFNLNVIGIRSKDLKLDEFNDQLLVVWKFEGEWHEKSYPITTLPGSYYLKQRLLNPKGCAILCPGQYRNIYGLRPHNNKYEAFCQTWGDVKVYRDFNRDNVFDRDLKRAEWGEFGINLHRAAISGCADKVGSYSAACQVFKCIKDFQEFMEIARKSKANFGNKFTYTLLEL